jgi:hypothetical protein
VLGVFFEFAQLQRGRIATCRSTTEPIVKIREELLIVTIAFGVVCVMSGCPSHPLRTAVSDWVV